MTAIKPSAGDGPLDEQGSEPTVEPTAADLPAEAAPSLVGYSSSYRCSKCAAELAVDQRYCVECGTRRGSPRFKVASPESGAPAQGMVPAGGAYAVSVAPGPSPRLLALLATVVVLLALGVGVLIGKSGNTVKLTSATPAAAGSSQPSSNSAAGSGSTSAKSGAKTTPTGTSTGYSFGS